MGLRWIQAWLRLNVYVRPHAVVCPKIRQASADVMSPNPSMQTTELAVVGTTTKMQLSQQSCNSITHIHIGARALKSGSRS